MPGGHHELPRVAWHNEGGRGFFNRRRKAIVFFWLASTAHPNAAKAAFVFEILSTCMFVQLGLSPKALRPTLHCVSLYTSTQVRLTRNLASFDLQCEIESTSVDHRCFVPRSSPRQCHPVESFSCLICNECMNSSTTHQQSHSPASPNLAAPSAYPSPHAHVFEIPIVLARSL